jgi:hypothetical protein
MENRLAVLRKLPRDRQTDGKIDGDADMCILAGFVVNAPDVWCKIHHFT